MLGEARTACRAEQWLEAEALSRRLLEFDPAGVEGLLILAASLREQGRLREAFDHYRRALALNPQYADAHFNLALLCERTGEALKAVHHWKCYLKLDRSGPWAEIAQRQLERLRKATLIPPRSG